MTDPQLNEPLPEYPDGIPPWADAETREERDDRSKAEWRRRDAMTRLGRVAMADALFLLLAMAVGVFCVVRIATHPQWDSVEKFIASVPLLFSGIGMIILAFAAESLMRNANELHGGVSRSLLFGAGAILMVVGGVSLFTIFAWHGLNPNRWWIRLWGFTDGWVCWAAGLSVLLLVPWHFWMFVRDAAVLRGDIDAPVQTDRQP